MTSEILVAAGLASTPISWTLLPALPSSCLAASMLSDVSGQTVVHSESVKARMTTLPRKSLSDIRWPNWFVSVKFGAGTPPSDEPGSRSGLAAASCCSFAADDALPADVPLPFAPLAELQPAAASAVTIAPAVTSMDRARRRPVSRRHDSA